MKIAWVKKKLDLWRIRQPLDIVLRRRPFRTDRKKKPPKPLPTFLKLKLFASRIIYISSLGAEISH